MEKTTKGNYCFPSIIGTAMRKVSQRIQYESTLLSIAIILISLMFIGIYTIFFSEVTLMMKIMAGINSIAAFIFLSSHLVTSFQQYQSYLQVMGLLEENNEQSIPDAPLPELNYEKGGINNGR